MEPNQILLTIVLILTALFLVFLIILCIKLLYTIEKTNIILADVEKKLKSVNGIFDTMDNIKNAITVVGTSLFDNILHWINQLFRKKEKENKE